MERGLAVSECSDTTAPELVALGYNPNNNNVRGEVRDASSGTLLSSVPFITTYRPEAIEVLPSFGDTTASELAVLAVNPINGAVIGQVRDASSGVLLKNTFFNSNYKVP